MEGQACCYETDIDNLRATELRLGLPGAEEAAKAAPVVVARGSKRAMPEESEDRRCGRNSPEAGSKECRQDTAPPAAKAQVVGWPPVRSYRKNSFKMMKEAVDAAALYVKVSMDGAPYLRKIDLKVYAGYKELRVALEDMFKCFSLGEISSEMEQHDVAERAIAYEDKDGDLMLVGDVPWEMFITSCKRLRIMKGSEAKG